MRVKYILLSALLCAALGCGLAARGVSNGKERGGATPWFKATWNGILAAKDEIVSMSQARRLLAPNVSKKTCKDVLPEEVEPAQYLLDADPFFEQTSKVVNPSAKAWISNLPGPRYSFRFFWVDHYRLVLSTNFTDPDFVPALTLRPLPIALSNSSSSSSSSATTFPLFTPPTTFPVTITGVRSPGLFSTYLFPITPTTLQLLGIDFMAAAPFLTVALDSLMDLGSNNITFPSLLNGTACPHFQLYTPFECKVTPPFIPQPSPLNTTTAQPFATFTSTADSVHLNDSMALQMSVDFEGMDDQVIDPEVYIPYYTRVFDALGKEFGFQFYFLDSNTIAMTSDITVNTTTMVPALLAIDYDLADTLPVGWPGIYLEHIWGTWNATHWLFPIPLTLLRTPEGMPPSFHLLLGGLYFMDTATTKMYYFNNIFPRTSCRGYTLQAPFPDPLPVVTTSPQIHPARPSPLLPSPKPIPSPKASPSPIPKKSPHQPKPSPMPYPKSPKVLKSPKASPKPLPSPAVVKKSPVPQKSPKAKSSPPMYTEFPGEAGPRALP